MTVTITEFGSFSTDNSVDDPVIKPSSIADSSWIISSITSNQIVANAQMQGHALTITLAGTFNPALTAGVKTFADFQTLNNLSGETIASQTLSFDGQVVGSYVFSTPVNAGLFSYASKSSIAAALMYTGKETFITGNGQTGGDRFYGYSGYATYNDNHLYSSSQQDRFVGGSGGINTLILPANKSSYSMNVNQIWDTNSQSSGALNGWELSDKSKTYATVQIANVQRIQFKDTSLALDVNGNAGTVAKVLGAVFGASFATNKEFVGIGLSYIDSGTNYADLMNLALTVKLGAGYTDTQEIQLLYQNLYGHAATNNEVTAIDSFITSGQYNKATLGVLAAETTNNAAKINLVGLMQTGIEYIPAG